MARATMVTGICSAVGGAAWTAACIVHDQQPTGCIGDGCLDHAMRDASPADAALMAVAGLLLAVSCLRLLLLARAAGGFGRVGTAAAATGAAGFALLAGAAVAMTIDGNWDGMPALVVPGVVLLAVGIVLVAWLVLRARLLPTALAALLLATAALLPFANEQTSRVLLAVPFGLAWLAAGIVLLASPVARRPAPATGVQ
ncbi:hypothetical protein [Angustibacter sp. Root456]|uniref:hypothetical protein n=1 Tax=Angustibacter sp. Root456 TaxID=1736539 RepID=UPI0006F467CE|nr:hypothetical protein [Angustibacter sp. Root456]KQX61689.1 hypothetical protein ASD06_13925 [Angustibacter sp. Root456]